MLQFTQIFESALMGALAELQILEVEAGMVRVGPAADLRFGDYQSNLAMVLAKREKTNPRALATSLVEKMELGGVAEASVAGPGFINFTVSAEYWSKALQGQGEDDRLGVAEVTEGKTIVLDFSAPNVAKPMHIGHIRSSIIGACLGRISSRLGHRVIRDNHLGDWGTQFGMVIWSWKREVNEAALEKEPLKELLRLYRNANEAGKAEPERKEEFRAELVKLQGGDAENGEIWERCVAVSRAGLEEMYERLGITFDFWMGESAYRDELGPLVEKLKEAGVARESEGAWCIFSEKAEKPEGDPFLIQKEGEWEDFPMMIQKKDGGFNYATTDLATLRFRVEEWKADAIWYVVDARQSQHFQQLFTVGRRLGYDQLELEHISFGTINGPDGKPLKTRAGDLPQLSDVLDDAVAAARKVVEERSRLELPEEKAALAELIGVSAVKFTELSHHRASDYHFDLEKMVALEGDTAPYLFYSYVRARSIGRKMEEIEGGAAACGDLVVTEEAEKQLARLLVRYNDTLHLVLSDFRPNLLATWLLDLARAFHSFFEACPVLKAEGAVRRSRWMLCELTARVLRDGMELLGMEAPERM